MTTHEQRLLDSLVDMDGVVVIQIGREGKDQSLRMSTNLTVGVKEQMLHFLKSNIDVFAWKHEDIPDIDPKIIAHKLNVDPKARAWMCVAFIDLNYAYPKNYFSLPSID